VPTCYRHPGRETYIRCQRCDRPICPDCMRDASVGFHCPSCVAEAAKTTRVARTAYGGQRTGNPQLTSQILIGINVAVWALIVATGGAASVWVDRLALWREDVVFSSQSGQLINVPGVSDGAYWQLLTSAFTHVEVWHIGFNMLALWFLGPPLESALGRVRFLALYLGSALSGSVLVFWFAPVAGYTLGASGAIFGLMGGLLLVALKVRGNVQQILMWIGLNFVITVVGRGFISWQGHLGGFLGGLAIGAVLIYAPRVRRTTWQVVGLGGIAVVLLLAVLLRTAQLT
jgi:membrane associated rhomboid family serine protease